MPIFKYDPETKGYRELVPGERVVMAFSERVTEKCEEPLCPICRSVGKWVAESGAATLRFHLPRTAGD